MQRLKLFLLMVACLLSAAAWSQEVSVGVYENAPKIYTDPQGKPAGLFVELLDEIARREGWTLRYVRCDWNDCLDQLESGQLDLMPDVATTDDRRLRFDFHDIVVAHSWSTVMVPEESPLQALPDLAGRRIAVLRGSVQEEALAKMMEGSGLAYQAVLVDELGKGCELVRDGKADAVVANSFFAGRHGSSYGLRESAIVFNPANLYFAVAKGRNAQLLEDIDDHLRVWRRDSDSIYFDAMRRAMAPMPTALGLTAGQRALLMGLGAFAVLLVATAALLRWQVRHRTRELDRSNARLEHLLGASPVVLYLLSVEGQRFRPQWVSSNVTRLFGLTEAETLSVRNWLERIHPDDRDRVERAFLDLPTTGQLTEEYRIVDAGGAPRHIRDEARLVTASGGPAEVIGSWSDLTQAREHEARLDFMAQHDSLTGLPNRTLLSDRLEQAIEAAAGAKLGFAVMLLNVDRLHRVNDGFGHDAGDALLRELARRLKGELRAGETLARVGSDEFAVLLSAGAGADDAAGLATRLLADVAQPCRYQQHVLTVTASIGICLYPADGQNPTELLKSADTALANAKDYGRNCFRFATAQMNAQAQRWVEIEHHLRRALEQDQFQLQYQPRASLSDGSVGSIEALLRWHSPELGLVAPGEFIPVAEDVGLIAAIGEWVLRAACRQNMVWQRDGLPPVRVAVNVSAHQVRSGDLPALVQRVLQETGLSPGHLELEITESVMMQDSETTLQQLAELHRIGVSVSLDDFGTGYSSLGYLSRFALDSLKIDQGFVRNITSDGTSAAIANATIGLAHGLGIKVIAEGIESAEQLRYLREAGCDEMQGFYFSRPLDAEATARLLREGRRLAL